MKGIVLKGLLTVVLENEGGRIEQSTVENVIYNNLYLYIHKH